MKEVVVNAWCDACWNDGQQRTPAVTPPWVIGVVQGKSRPVLHEVEACEVHSKPLADLLALIGQCEVFMPPNAAPKAVPNAAGNGVRAPRSDFGGQFTTARGDCPICGVELAVKSTIMHIYSQHVGSPRPPQPSVCPDCKRKFNAPFGIAKHRIELHGYDPMQEAVNAARTAMRKAPR